MHVLVQQVSQAPVVQGRWCRSTNHTAEQVPTGGAHRLLWGGSSLAAQAGRRTRVHLEGRCQWDELGLAKVHKGLRNGKIMTLKAKGMPKTTFTFLVDSVEDPDSKTPSAKMWWQITGSRAHSPRPV